MGRGIPVLQRKHDERTGTFLNAYGDAIKDDVFKEKLGRISIKELARTAKDRRSGSLGFAEAILIYYNKKAGTRLPGINSIPINFRIKGHGRRTVRHS